MELRPAVSGDLERVSPLLDAMGHVAEKLVERFQMVVAHSDHCLLVAVSESHPAGYAWAQSFGPHLRTGATFARLHDLFVLPDYRRQGVGRSLFEGVVAWAHQAGIAELQWQAPLEAGPFYAGLGFQGDTKSDLEQYPWYELELRPFK